jgi:squalene-hopene/tetraprenyl-beta-curcumene cyclase
MEGSNLMRTTTALIVALGMTVASTSRVLAETNIDILGKGRAVKTPTYDPKEPIAARMSLARSVEYLDNMAAFWMERKDVKATSGQTGLEVLTSCGSCHTNHTYLMVRPLLTKAFPKSEMEETRRWLERRMKIFDRLRRNGTMFYEDDGLVGYSALEFVSIATALVFYDAQTMGTLQPGTRAALTKMWALQNGSGDWNQLDSCASMSFPVVEFDGYYGATLAALATGIAPEDYAKSDEAKAGLAKLRRFFKNNPPPNLHHKAMLMWASLRTEGLMTPEERSATIKGLLKLQRDDGGWSMSNFNRMSEYSRGRFDDPASDGYATGFFIYVLRQAGVSASSPEIVRGINWLKTHQRQSGSWFTAHRLGHNRTEGGLGTRGLSVLNLGTAFAVMALKSCEEAPSVAEKKK